MPKKIILSIVILISLAMTGCGGKSIRESADYQTVEEMRADIINIEEARTLTQGLSASAQGFASWNEMSFAIRQSLDVIKLKPASEVAVVLPGQNPVQLTRGDLRKSLERMLEILPYLDVNPGLLADEFTWLRLAPDFGFTGYYEPSIKADYKRSEKYRYPIYGLPPDMKKGVPYHDRHAIDRRHVLAGKGLELAWVEDDVDIFFLQIQGSGRLLFPDGKIKHVLYAGKNNQPYVPLGRVMANKGLLKTEQISMPSIRKCLAENPARKAELLDCNPSYIFFHLKNEGPVGGMGRPLTPRMSLAVDPRVLPYGSLLFFRVNLPDSTGRHSRDTQALALPQDTGGAIRGRRIDLFMGAGEEAEHVAGHMNSVGVVYILLPVEGGSFTHTLHEKR